MNGREIKELLVNKKVDLNKCKYYNNDEIYNADMIDKVTVPKDALKRKLIEKFGIDMCNLIMAKVYGSDTEEYCDPKMILNVVGKVK